MPEISFPSEWLKINNNVKNGDTIRFTDAGTQNDEGNYIFNVQIIHQGELTEIKKFQLNKTNFDSVSKLYGTNSDKWVGKEMGVEKIKQRKPGSSDMVDSILLVEPTATEEVSELDGPF
jgi:hypothetical protein